MMLSKRKSKYSKKKEKRKIKIVIKDRRDILGNNDENSPLVFRVPQLKAAEAGLRSAEFVLKTALRNLSDTAVKIPFDTIIVTRHVAPGQFIQTGSKLATIYSANKIEFRLNLPLEQWEKLPKQASLYEKVIVNITDLHNNQLQGKIERIEQHINVDNRQRALIIRVDNPLQQTPQLLAGTFEKIDIELNVERKLLAVPIKSINTSGNTWYVNKENNLANFPDSSLPKYLSIH